jgi:hypothetical protein
MPATAPARQMTDDQAESDDVASTRHDDLLHRFAGFCTPEQQRRGATPAEILGALPPQERLALLDSRQLILELPEAVLEALAEEVLQGLSPATREAVRKRLGR